jgi:hypothetical protein
MGASRAAAFAADPSLDPSEASGEAQFDSQDAQRQLEHMLEQGASPAAVAAVLGNVFDQLQEQRNQQAEMMQQQHRLLLELEKRSKEATTPAFFGPLQPEGSSVVQLPKLAKKLLSSHENILFQKREEYESTCQDNNKILQLKAAFTAATVDAQKRDPVIPSEYKVTLPKLSCLDNDTLAELNNTQKQTFRSMQSDQLKLIQQCLAKNAEIKKAAVQQVREDLSAKLDMKLSAPVAGDPGLSEVSDAHKKIVLERFDANAKKTLYTLRIERSDKRDLVRDKKDQKAKTREEENLKELSGQLDRQRLLQEIAGLQLESTSEQEPTAERRTELEQRLTACETELRQLNSNAAGQTHPRRDSKKGQGNPKRHKPNSQKATAVTITPASQRPGQTGRGRGRASSSTGRASSGGKGRGKARSHSRGKGKVTITLAGNSNKRRGK